MEATTKSGLVVAVRTNWIVSGCSVKLSSRILRLIDPMFNALDNAKVLGTPTKSTSAGALKSNISKFNIFNCSSCNNFIIYLLQKNSQN